MIRKRLTYANVIATLALFLALGGSSYALTVGSGSIRNNSIRSVDVRNGTLRDRDVKRGALGGRAIKESALGTVNAARTVNGTITTTAQGNNNAVAECPGSYRVLSGGATVVGGGGALTASRPDPGTTGGATSPNWRASRAGGQVRAYAICVAE
jgi:hypothetical protein